MDLYCTLHIVHCTLHTQWCEYICALLTVRCTLNTVRCTLRTVHCTLHGPCGSNPPESVGQGSVSTTGVVLAQYVRVFFTCAMQPLDTSSKQNDGNARVVDSSLWKHAPPRAHTDYVCDAKKRRSKSIRYETTCSVQNAGRAQGLERLDCMPRSVARVEPVVMCRKPSSTHGLDCGLHALRV